jgi:predicted amidophosphoribosyltransferase
MPPVVAPPPPPLTRPLCPVCARRTASKTGVCYNCRMALVFHCRTYPHRLPSEGTLSRQALAHINIFRAEELKQGAIILRMREQLDAL